jgi:metallo-beta-lactamase class B
MRGWLVLLSVLVPVSGTAVAQEPADSSEAAGHLNAARQIAGDEWQTTVDFLCGPDPDPGNAAETAVMTPTKVFDNLYAFGRSGAVVYAITTDDGIILIDSGYSEQVESVLVPGLLELGLSVDDIRYIIVAHGHRDHYGGSRHLQEQYGATVVLSEADWDFIDQYRTDTAEGALSQPPDRDMVAEEGKPIVLGDTSVTPVLVPGHTPGALGLIFSVRDGDEEHVAGMFGGTILITSRISDAGLSQYLTSLEHFGIVAREMGVDVEIQNHPIVDNMGEKLQQLSSRSASEPHPFVVGGREYQNFLGVITECTQAEVARRSGG